MSKPSVFLISSNLHSQFSAMFPNGVGALSAYLKERGYRVGALHIERKRDLRRIGRQLRAFRPDVVGFSCLSCEAPLIEPVGAAAKAWNPDVPYLVGGIHAIMNPEHTARRAHVDGVCAGEGELAFLEYLRRIEQGEDVGTTPNFAFLKDGELVENEKLEFIQDLDSLPMLDRSVADLNQAIAGNHGTINLIFGRGCPWKCKFCGNAYLWAAGKGRWARMSSVERAMEEIAVLARDYPFREIVIRDDTFSWNLPWAEAFLDAYAERFTFPLHIFSRSDTLTPALIDKLSRAHCASVFIGLDSGNDHVRNVVLGKEQESNEELIEGAERLKAAGITPMISNIVGLPFETPEAFRETIEINRRIHQDRVVFLPSFGAGPKIWVFTPWPGSELCDISRDNGWLVHAPESRKVYRESALDMPGFGAREVDRQYRRFRYNVYKESFPGWAMLFLLFDSRPVQFVYEHVPKSMIGGLRDGLQSVFNRVLGARGSGGR